MQEILKNSKFYAQTLYFKNLGKDFTDNQREIHPFGSVWCKIEFLLAKITYLKSAVMLFFKHCEKRYGLEHLNELLYITIA